MGGDALAFALVSLAALVIKGATGFGAAMVMVAVGGLFVGVEEAVVASSLLNAVAGLAMLPMTRAWEARGFWGPLVVPLALGSVLGAWLLAAVPSDALGLPVGLAIVAVAGWLVAGRPGVGGPSQEEAPARPGPAAHLMGLVSGLCGGFLGVSGPPAVLYLGSFLEKTAFRQVLVPVLLVGAVARVAAYGAEGMIDGQVLTLSLASVPALVLGPWLGDRIFKRLPERAFVVAVGLTLMAIGVRWVAVAW